MPGSDGAPAVAAVFFDFAGVLTSSLFDSFSAFCAEAGLPHDDAARSLAEDPLAAAGLAAFERGEGSHADFESALAASLSARNAPVSVNPAGLVGRLTAGLRPDPEMLALVERTRKLVPVALVSNSFGLEMYDGYDLQRRFDALILSSDVGVRKPSRAIYRRAAERVAVAPEACVMVDDLEINVAGARRAGLRGILHRTAAETASQLAEALGDR
jgi:putative hydrolase of the HAD superfamily